MIPTTATQAATSTVSSHFWHGVEGLAFLLICVLGLAFGEWRQRRRDEQGHPRTARTSRIRGEFAPHLVTAAALSSAAAAAVHFVVMPDHFEESGLYGGFFLVTATAQLLYSALLVAKPSRAILTAGLVATTAVLGLWLSTRLIAIPLGPAAGEREAFGGLDILASSFEALFIVSAALSMRAALPTPRCVARLLVSPATAAFSMTGIGVIAATAYLYPPA
jgi:hypothetical protein